MYKNVYEKMVALRDEITPTKRETLLLTYRYDVSLTWLLDYIFSDRTLPIDRAEVERQYDMLPELAEGGYNSADFFNKNAFSTMLSVAGLGKGGQIINHTGFLRFIDLVENGDEEKVVAFLANMCYHDERDFLIKVLNGESFETWIEERIARSILNI